MLWLVIFAGFACLDVAAFLWAIQAGLAAVGLSLLVIAYLVTLSERG